MRSDATALVENLASEGFVVVAIDHTHESQLVEFPDGRLVRGTFVDTGPASNLRALQIRAAVASVSGYLTAFFDRYLRGTTEAVLRDPSTTYPELRPLH